MDRATRIERLKRLLQERVLVTDGGMGTSIQALDLSAEDFGGVEFDGCNEYLNITRPDRIRDIHRTFLKAGADIVETNSFGSTPLVLGEYGLAHRARAEHAKHEPDDVHQDQPLERDGLDAADAVPIRGGTGLSAADRTVDELLAVFWGLEA